jgi:hypothetical protein
MSAGHIPEGSPVAADGTALPTGSDGAGAPLPGTADVEGVAVVAVAEAIARGEGAAVEVSGAGAGRVGFVPFPNVSHAASAAATHEISAYVPRPVAVLISRP